MLSLLPRGLSGLEHLRALLASGRQPPIHETLDIALVSADEGMVVVQARPSQRHINPAGIVQGGYMAAVLDAACGCAVHSVLAPDTGFSTLELKIAYHCAVTSGTGVVRAEGRVLSSGRRAAFSEAKLFDADKRLLASASSSLLIVPFVTEA
jgi:uncharacterized protein (TIGR00369 family)